MNTIKELRKSKKLSQKDLAEILNVHQTAVSQWEQNRTMPDIDMIKKLAKYFGVTTDYILGDSQTDNSKEIKAHRIKVYGHVPAGIPLEAVEDVIDWEEIPYDWTRDGSEFLALKVKGSSMNPKYLDGDIVIIKKQPDCESGQDAVVFINGYDATLKRVIKNENSVILQPLNPEYETKIYGSSDDPITILGIVVELRRKV
jgi:repressor LexA